MQQIVLTAIVVISLTGVTALAVWRLTRHGHPSALIQVLMGAMMGLLGLFIVLVLGIDVVPDDAEAVLQVTLALAVTLLIIAWALLRSRTP